jgi:hypothetical protein
MAAGERWQPTAELSAECALAARSDYGQLHGTCRQAADVPLPHGLGMLLMRRCPCSCHAIAEGGR